jgi:hypothetical protein
MSEVMFTPTWNRSYVVAQQQMAQERD